MHLYPLLYHEALVNVLVSFALALPPSTVVSHKAKWMCLHSSEVDFHIQWDLYNETGEVLLKHTNFIICLAWYLRNHVYFRCREKPRHGLERPRNLVVALYRFQCIVHIYDQVFLFCFLYWTVQSVGDMRMLKFPKHYLKQLWFNTVFEIAARLSVQIW